MSLINHPLFSAYAQADGFGKLVFLGLYALSTISWLVLIYKIRGVRRISHHAKKFHKFCFSQDKSILEWDLVARENPFSLIYHAIKHKTIEILEKNHFFLSQQHAQENTTQLSRQDIELIESYSSVTVAEQIQKLEHFQIVLATTVTLAPFLGLLGTVWGILCSFGGLQKGASLESSSSILGGISTALATTVLGLLIAIPALIAHNYLRSKTRELSAEMEGSLYRMIALLELEYRKID